MADSKQFFISYNQSDRQMAEWIAWQLEAAGYSVVIQAWDFGPAQNFVLAMDQAAQTADRTLVLLSPAFLASRFTAPEWAAAFARDPTGALGLLLPVRVKDCNPAGLLGQIVYIDLVGVPSKDEARQRLLAGVDRARRKPATEPTLPPLEPGLPQQPSRPEPSWVADLEVGADVAASVFWRLAQPAGVALVAALGFHQLFGSQFPAWQDDNPRGLALTALVLGGLVALLAEALRRAWRRRHRAAAAVVPGGAGEAGRSTGRPAPRAGQRRRPAVGDAPRGVAGAGAGLLGGPCPGPVRSPPCAQCCCAARQGQARRHRQPVGCHP